MRHVCSVIPLVLATLAVAAVPAEAQYRRYGFIGAGIGGVEHDYYESDFTLSAGYLARFGPEVGVYVGIRTPLTYSRFTPDAEALLDSLGASSGSVEGGAATVVESGIEAVAGYDTGALGGYGWAGIHYLSETRNDGTITTPGGPRPLAQRSRTDFGPSYGAGLQFRFGRSAAVFTEWYRSAGFDDRMLRMSGLRFGVTGQF
ncbi:MAG TPA: outer membrane beta-barrel protein [Longimicrobium sp.]